MSQIGTITLVERQKRTAHRYNIYIDDEFAFAVHEDVLVAHRLFKGETIDAESVQAILEDEEREGAYIRALKWLGSRQRTEREIRIYFRRKEVPDGVVREVLDRLRNQGYVDDERFSRTLAEERLNTYGKGKRWIRQELMHKGVDKEIVEETVADIGEEEELRSAELIARKRWRQLSRDPDRAAANRKLFAFLARRGFSASVVQTAVRNVTRHGGFDEAEEWGWE